MKTISRKRIGLLSVTVAVMLICVFAVASALLVSAADTNATTDFTENSDPATDYAYSFAVVGDTQKLVYNDAYFGTDYTSYIYDWIVQNKKSKKIKLVMGLGDITDKDGEDVNDDGIDQTNVEWDIATAQLAKLENAGIPYTLVRGNHDTVAKLDEYFAANPNFTGGEIGYYDGTSLGNYYMKFTIGGHNYMVFVFAFGPHNDILTWASGEIAANPDYKVILTTHAYMYSDGTTLDINDDDPPRKANYTSSRNNGNDIWYKLASQYENIILVLSGHDPNYDIVWRQDLGDNGNTVTQFLIDPQSLDSKQGYTTGMVAMFYFSEDGSRVKVEYVSTYHSLENGEGKDYVYNASKNCFEFTIPEKVEMTPVATENYGVIDAKYSNPVTYPVVAFEKTTDGYGFIGGYYDFGAAETAIVNTTSAWKKDFVILLRGDAEIRSYSNLGSLTASLTIDLNGHKLIQSGKSYLVYIYRNLVSDTTDLDVRVKITVKNGSIVKASDNYALVAIDYGAKCNRPYSVPIAFDNVTFTVTGDGNSIFRTLETGYTSLTDDNVFYAKPDIVFNDCTFDYTNSREGVTMLDMTNENGYDRIQYAITVNGGSIISGAEFGKSDFIVADGNTNGRADSVVFGKGANGKYTELVLRRDVASPSEDEKYFTAEGEEYTFVLAGSREGSAIYVLSGEKIDIPVDPLETKYGTIPEECADVEAYPVVAFEKTSGGYTFIGGYSELGAANAAIKNVTKAYMKDFAVLLRANAEVKTESELSTLTGNYKLDLGGYTLTQTESGYTFRVYRNVASEATDTVDKRVSISVENGSIVNASGSPIAVIDFGKNCNRPFGVSFDFNNVTISSTSKNYGIFATWENGSASMDSSNGFYASVDAVFTDCTFDIANSGSGIKMLTLTNSKGYDRTVYNVTINGGAIISDETFSKDKFIATNDNTNGRADSVAFGKNSDGEYTYLVLPTSVNAPSANDRYVNKNGDEYAFVKASSSDGKVVYRLSSVAAMNIDFIPKMSITLESQLVVNVYIPKENLIKFTFNGNEYTKLEDLAKNIVTINGKEYYRMSLPLPAAEAAKNIKLAASISIGENTATGTFTFSIPKYAQKVLNSSSGDVEKTLVKDVLAYIRSAYVYFESSDKATVIAAIDTIIGDYNNEFVKVDGVVNIGNGLYGVQFIIEEKPRIRFYLTAGASSSTYTFRYANKVLEYEAEGTAELGGTTYNYVDISLYAYQLIGEITYTDGTNNGSYHINSYYDFITTDTAHKNNISLITFIEKLYNYSKSAYEYRRSVTVPKHNYTENIIAPTCEDEGYTIYTCSDCGYSYRGNVVAPHGHSWSDWFVSKNVSKTDNGEMRQNCSNCSKINTKSVPAVISGNIGAGSTFANNVIYTIYEDGTLKLTGNGATGDVSWNGAKQPFIDYRESITRIVVEDTITSISRALFAYIPNLVYVDLSTGLTEYPANLFMDSFSAEITSFTIPANVNTVKYCLIGQYNQKNALFTDVYIENPDIMIVDSANDDGKPYVLVNTYISRCSNLTLYSYGSSNNVKDYADLHGFKYVDLNSSFEGESDNLSYNYSLGTLTLAPKDSNFAVTLPEDAPWLEKIAKTDVTKIVIEQGISNIPAEYFKGYTALTSVVLPKRIEAIGSGAFATESTCSTPLILDIGDGVAFVSDDFLKNRTSVTVNSFEGCAFDDYSQDGVTVVLKKAFKLLLIGNSLSNDAADVSLGNPSQLYNIIKSMVGDDVYIQIGVLYSGAKTAGWHATVAEKNAHLYTFYLINEDTNGLWTSNSDYTSKEGLLFDAWDIVTIQPYGEEARTGSGSSIDGDANIANTSTPKLEKFYALSASIPYLLDYINAHCSNAKIYYYMTWSNYQKANLNGALSDYGKMVDILKNASLYVGSESRRGFDGVIPVGTAIQNARSTYLALQYYVTDNDSEAFYFVKGLQRDNVHLNTTFGRYIAGLSFAEIIVPIDLRLEEYTLSNIKNHALIGPLPLEFTTIAQLSVEKMLNTLYLTGDAQYSYTAIEGYTEEPTAKCAKEIEDLVIEAIEVSDKAALVEAILEKIEHLVPNEVKALVNIAQNMDFSNTYKDCEVEISISYGFATTVVTKIVSAKLTTPTAEIVNKNNADATVTFVIDDGNWDTARFAKEMLLKYSNLTVSFAVPTKQLATLQTEDADGDGIPEYVMVDGKYVYEVNDSNYAFWQDILLGTRAEIINHSFTHGFWGTNDDGGTFEYVKNGESTATISELMPKGSSTKEIYAVKQILEKLFPNNISPNSTALSFITPGIGIKTVDHKLSDGSVVTTYKTYFNEILKSAYNNGDLIGANSTFGATYDPTLDLSTKVVTKNNFSTYESRMTIPRYMVEHYNANPDGLVNDDISNWTDYIDSAIDLNGWACFCIHMILENESASGHNITKAQAEKLFKYALDNNVWVATNTEAILYFSEWSTASVSTSYENEEINVTLTDNERDDVYNMALTVKVSVPDSWQSAVSGGSTYEVIRSDGVSYVLVDIVPDSGIVTLSEAN